MKTQILSEKEKLAIEKLAKKVLRAREIEEQSWFKFRKIVGFRYTEQDMYGMPGGDWTDPNQWLELAEKQRIKWESE